MKKVGNKYIYGMNGWINELMAKGGYKYNISIEWRNEENKEAVKFSVEAFFHEWMNSNDNDDASVTIGRRRSSI